MLIIAVAGFITAASAAISMLSFFTVSQTQREAEWHQIRLTAKSALNQSLYRIKRQAYSKNKKTAFLTGEEWENIILGSNDGTFHFDASCDRNFSIDNGCKVSITFSGQPESMSVYNFSSGSPVSIPGRKNQTPPYSVDLIIKSSGASLSKTFEAVIEKKWPYCIASGTYAADIGRSSEIQGDVYSAGQMQVTSPYPSLCFARLSKERQLGEYPKVRGNLYAYGGKNENNKLGLTSEHEITKERAFAIDPYADFKGSKKIIYEKMQAFDSEDFAPWKADAEDITDALIEEGAIEPITEESLREFRKYTSETHSDIMENISERALGGKKIYIMRKNIYLYGESSSSEAPSGSFSKSSSGSYHISGSIVSYPDILIKKSGRLIECSGCSLFIDGDMLLLKNFDPYGASKAHDSSLIPSIKGTQASVCVSGNLYASGGRIESSSDRFVLYCNENIYLRPFFTIQKEKSIFKGAIACRKHLTVNPPEDSSGAYSDQSIWIKGAVLCGPHEKEISKIRSIYPNENRGKDRILIENAKIEYDPDTISLLHRYIGIPKLSLWKEL